jgi:hypothetical protein
VLRRTLPILIAFAATAAPARADDLVAQLTRDTPIAAYGGTVAWSAYDATTKLYSLEIQRGSTAPVAAGVRPSSRPFDVSLGPDAAGHTVALYTRCTPGCDVYRYDLRRETKVAAVSSPTADEAWPVQWGNLLAFVRRHAKGGTGEVPECDVPYVKVLGSSAPSRRLDRGSCGATTGMSIRGSSIVQVTVGTPPSATRFDSQVRLLSAHGGPSRLLARQGFGEESNVFSSPTQAAGTVFVTRTGDHPQPTFVSIDRRTGRRTEVAAHTNLTGPLAAGFYYVEGGDFRGESCNDAVPVPCRLVHASASPFSTAVRSLLPKLTISAPSDSGLPVFGDPFALSGRLTQTVVSGSRVVRTDPLGGVPIAILSRVDDPSQPGLHESFHATPLGATTAADGSWSVPLATPPPAPSFSAVTESPAVATTYAGRGTVGTVSARITLTVTGSAVAGTITPAQPGRTVSIQRLLSRKCVKVPGPGPDCMDSWTTVGTAPVDAAGTAFATTLAAPPTAGTYSAALPFADTRTDPSLYSGRSPDTPVG